MDYSPKKMDMIYDIPYEPPLNPSTKRRNIFLAAFAAQLYVVVMGMVSTYSSPACEDMQKPGSHLRDITSNEKTWIASLPMLSGVFGNAFSGYVSHKFGRKTTLMFLSVTYTFGWLLIAHAPTVPFIYVGRIICGINAGMCTVAVPAYVVEISTVEIRGLLSASFMTGVALGSFIMTGFGIILRWSWLAVLGASVITLAASILCLMPESPPWLVKKGRRFEALKAIQFLKGENHDAMKELKEIQEIIDAEPKSSFSVRELLDPGLYKPLIVAFVLMFNMSFCGFPAVISYSVGVFASTKSSLDPNMAATILVMVQVVATIVGSILMDKAGRKILYILSGFSMALSLTIFGIYTYISTKHDTIDLSNWTWVPILSLIIYLSAFSLGFGSIPFVVIPELIPTTKRSFVMAVASVTGSFFGFIITKAYDEMKNSMGLYGTYWFYGVISLLGAVFYWIFVPETKGRTIQEIHKSFTASKETE